MGSLILFADSFFARVLLAEMDASDRWWDLGHTIAAWALGIVGTALLGVITHIIQKADKKLDRVVEVQGRHAELFASILERNRSHDEWRSRLETDQNKQWEDIKEHGESLAEHGQTLAVHGKTLKYLESHPALGPRGK